MELSPLNKVIPSYGSPTLEDFDLNSVAPGQRIKGASNRQFVLFYKKTDREPVTLEAKINETTGASTPTKVGIREVQREYVKIVTPGDKIEVDTIAEEFHKREHFRHYKAFRDGRTAPMGKSIDECTYVSSGIATELRILGVHTEEQFADASDHVCGMIPMGHELREFARACVGANANKATDTQVTVLKGELEKSQSVIAAMQSQLNEMKGMILNAQGKPIENVEAVIEGIKKSPKRPKKTELVTE